MSFPLTVIINSFRRPKELVNRALKSALEQKPKINRLIFIDQNEPSLSLSSDVAQDPRLDTIKTAASAVAKARNVILRNNLEGWLIFCDDDGYLDKNYTEVLLEHIQKYPEVDIFAGSIIRDDNGEFYTKRHQVGGDLNQFAFTKLLMGSNFCVKAETFRELNGFDERFGAGSYWGSGEETDFAWKAHFAKKKMMYVPSLRVLHLPPYAQSFKQNIEKAFRYGRGKGALVSKWLLEEHQVKVSIEFFEMLVLPFFQSLTLILRFQFKKALYPVSSWLGRVWGLLAFVFLKCSNQSLKSQAF